MSDRYVLTIEMTRKGDALTRTLRIPHESPIEMDPQRYEAIGAGYEVGTHRGLGAIDRILMEGDGKELEKHLAGTSLVRAGEVLFEALFGPAEASWQAPLARLTRDIDHVPTRHPVHVRVVTNDPKLREMPWGLTSFEGSFLRDYGWTFVVAQQVRETESEDLLLPTGILLILPEWRKPDDKIESDKHRAELTRLLDDHFPGAARRKQIVVASTREEVLHALQVVRPAIVYYYGHGKVEGGQPSLHVPAVESRTGENRADWNAIDVVRAFRDSGAPVRIVFLNGCMTGRGAEQSIPWKLLEIAPLVLAQPTTAWTRSARHVAFRWFKRFLEEKEQDPITAAMARSPREPTGPAWMPLLAFTRSATFAISYARPHDWRTILASDLDRHSQRKDAFAELHELVDSQTRRVQAFLIYGPKKNRHEEVADQLHRYIERRDVRFNLVMPSPMQVAGEAFTSSASTASVGERRDLIEGWLKLSVGCDWRLALRDVLEHIAPPPSRGRPRVLWLDWGKLDKPKNRLDVEAWLTFCSGALTKACPSNVRVIVSLSLEVDRSQLNSIKDRLDEHVNDPRLHSELFRCGVLPPLDIVGLGEIVEFLGLAGCPQNIRDELARWMKTKTGGEYEELRQLIEDVYPEGSWLDLYAKLQEEFGQDLHSSDY